MRDRSHIIPSLARRLTRGCTAWLLLPAILVTAALLLPMVSVLTASAQIPAWVPFPLHSVLTADYRSDELDHPVPALEVRAIEAAIRDQESGVNAARLTQVVGQLQTPVPTITPQPGAEVQPSSPTAPPPTGTAELQATATRRPTRTPAAGWTTTPDPTASAIMPSPTERPVLRATATAISRARPTRPATEEPKPTPLPAPTDIPTPRPPEVDPYPGPDPPQEPTRNPYP
jgi:hypothetical protein